MLYKYNGKCFKIKVEFKLWHSENEWCHLIAHQQKNGWWQTKLKALMAYLEE